MATTMAAAAAFRSAASRLSRSASSIVAREVTGHHNLTIDGYKATRKLPITWYAASQTFEAAGYTWCITYHPNNNSWKESIDLYLEPVAVDGDAADRLKADDPVEFRFGLLDGAGNPVLEHTQSSKGACFFSGESRTKGFPGFIKWKDLEESGCLKDDRFTVRCDITVVKNWTESAGAGDGDDSKAAAAAAQAAASRVVVPPSDLHDHLVNLLWKKEGKDVTFAVAVGGEAAYEYDAHGWLLAARSPVFETELLAAAKEKVPGGGVRRRVEVQGIEPHVFHAMLHFMYTDTLPPAIAEGAVVEQARSLLAAAHRYKLERLKLMCEEMLCERIDVGTVAGSLAATEKHGCSALKDACMEFISRPGVLKAVMETEGFEKMKADCPDVMLELVMKQLAA